MLKLNDIVICVKPNSNSIKKGNLYKILTTEYSVAYDENFVTVKDLKTNKKYEGVFEHRFVKYTPKKSNTNNYI